MPTLHLHCDLREPSLSRALHEARRLSSYKLQIRHIRSRTFAENIMELAEAMDCNDVAMIFLLHARDEQRDVAGEVVKSLAPEIRSRITISCSSYSDGMLEWVEKIGLVYDTNIYEAPRKRGWIGTATEYSVTLEERNWIQYRLMRVLIAGKNPADIYTEIIETLRSGKLSRIQLQRGERFFERGEPDMAGGQYSDERHSNPNAIDRLRDRGVQIGRSGLNTMIIGETGTGKESLAWYLHDFSLRIDQPFIALNCAFFEAERLESELFGHEQGAFTDAKKSKKGLVEIAAGGTLFLDELPEMAPRVQAKLLRFLQDGSYTRMGGTKMYRSNVRVIGAAQPERMEKLRPDLYYRIADVELHTVPLRKMKPNDVANIACNLAYRLMWQPVISVDGETVLTPKNIREIWDIISLQENVSALSLYSWPGNMRELSTLIKRLVLLGDAVFEELKIKKRPQESGDEWKRFVEPIATFSDIAQRNLLLKDLQPAFVRQLVNSLGGWKNIQPTKLAEALGCSYNTLISYKN